MVIILGHFDFSRESESALDLALDIIHN